jgi:hypothetical protein
MRIESHHVTTQESKNWSDLNVLHMFTRDVKEAKRRRMSSSTKLHLIQGNEY